MDLSSQPEEIFEALWALIDYTLEFPRGARDRPEKDLFRRTGRMIWTTADVDGNGKTDLEDLPTTHEAMSKTRMFLYVRCETDDLVFFAMVNSLFSLMLEEEPSNHLHSILIPKAYLVSNPGL